MNKFFLEMESDDDSKKEESDSDISEGSKETSRINIIKKATMNSSAIESLRHINESDFEDKMPTPDFDDLYTDKKDEDTKKNNFQREYSESGSEISLSDTEKSNNKKKIVIQSSESSLESDNDTITQDTSKKGTDSNLKTDDSEYSSKTVTPTRLEKKLTQSPAIKLKKSIISSSLSEDSDVDGIPEQGPPLKIPQKSDSELKASIPVHRVSDAKKSEQNIKPKNEKEIGYTTNENKMKVKPPTFEEKMKRSNQWPPPFNVKKVSIEFGSPMKFGEIKQARQYLLLSGSGTIEVNTIKYRLIREANKESPRIYIQPGSRLTIEATDENESLMLLEFRFN